MKTQSNQQPTNLMAFALTPEDESQPKWLNVTEIAYSIHIKKDSNPPSRSLKAAYFTDTDGVVQVILEYIPLFHPNPWASSKAMGWWTKHCEVSLQPKDLDEALRMASFLLFDISRIKVQQDGRFFKILKWEKKQEALPVAANIIDPLQVGVATDLNPPYVPEEFVF